MRFFDSKELNRNLFWLGLTIFFVFLGADLFSRNNREFHVGWFQWIGMALGLGILSLSIINRYRNLSSVQELSDRIHQTLQQLPIRPLQRPPAVVLTVVCIITIVWQSTFALAADRLDRTYMNRAASGMTFQYSFVYFYYYENLYPVFSTMNDVFYPGWQEIWGQPAISGFVQPEYSKQAAENLIKEHPETLLMDLGWSIRTGDDGRALLYLPETILRGTPEGAGVSWFLSWIFIVSLLSLLIASYYADKFFLGIFLVAFLGSHPFQLAELYNKGYVAQFQGITWSTGQVFSLPISLIVFLAALHFPLIFDRPVTKYYLWLLPIVSGALIASARQVRGENIVAIISLLICYALAVIPWRKKLLMALLTLASFWVFSQGWGFYFRYKFLQAYQVVKDAGGHPLSIDDKLQYHAFWSTLWEGLGDFGSSKGYEWSDGAVYSYVCPILKSQGKLEGRQCRDMSKMYPEVPWMIPGFEIISRNKVAKDILRDPLWYAEILLKRVQRILVEVAPARLGLGAYYFDLPLPGGLLIPFLIVLALVRKWPHVKLILFTLPLAASAFLIYSGKGMTYYSVFVQVMAAICCVAILNSVVWVSRVIRAERRAPALIDGKVEPS